MPSTAAAAAAATSRKDSVALTRERMASLREEALQAVSEGPNEQHGREHLTAFTAAIELRASHAPPVAITDLQDHLALPDEEEDVEQHVEQPAKRPVKEHPEWKHEPDEPPAPPTKRQASKHQHKLDKRRSWKKRIFLQGAQNRVEKVSPQHSNR